MEVTIGIRNVSRELTFLIDEDADFVAEKVNTAIVDGGSLSLTDSSGRVHVVPAAAIGYVITGSPEPRRVGFVV